MTSIEGRLARWLHFLDEGIWEYTIDTETFWCSDTLTTLLNNSSKPLTSFHSLLSYIHPEDRKILEESMTSVQDSQVTLSRVVRVGPRDSGAYDSCLLRVGMSAEGDRVLGSFRLQGREEQFFQESEVTTEIVHAILDNTSAVIFVKDREGHYLYLNRQFQALFNVTRDIIGKTDYDVFPKDISDRLREADKQVFDAGHVIELLERVPLNGELRTYISTKVPLFKADGTMYAIAGIATDITSEQRAKDEIARVAAMKTQFLANMSHEIRTPLNGVLLSAELLEDSSLTDTQMELLSSIRHSTESLLHIVNTILDFSKLEAEKPVLLSQAFLLSEAVTSVFELHQLNGVARQIKLTMFLDEALASVYVGDSERISQMLHHLLGNAVKFTQADGRVRFEARRLLSLDEHDVVQFVVDDTGIGIPPEMATTIFKPFTQGDSSNSRVFGGTGLGLAICYRLAELLNGHIALVEKSEKGARFEVSIPLKRDVSNQPTHGNDNLDARDTTELVKNASILLVEDNEVNRRVTAKALEKFVSQVDCAGNGRIACDMARKHSYDLILMDIQMPEVDGIEATKIIRAIDAMRETPIIALTAHVIEGYKESLQLIGFTDYLSKPVSRLDLFRLIQKWVS